MHFGMELPLGSGLCVLCASVVRSLFLRRQNRIRASDLNLLAARHASSMPIVTQTAAIQMPLPQEADAGVQLPPGQSLEDFLERIERRVITEALEATRWNKTAAAKNLGITFRALRYRLKKYGIQS